ncbi:MAG: hypothetical protein PVF37_00910 [Desulfobacterales bacterium]|jgi:hypothetical protein
MKIQTNEPIAQTYLPEPKVKDQQKVGKEFDSILKEAVENTLSETVTAKQTVFVNPVRGLQPASSPELNQSVTYRNIEEMLNLLERYRDKLADPQVTLKQIDPYIMELNRGMETLAPLLDKLPAGNGLRNILNQTMVTMSLEISKFHRGDYISS